MKLVNLNDVPLDGLQAGVETVRKYAQAVIEFDNNWKLISTEIRKEPTNLSVIAVIGPSGVGPMLHLEVGFRRFLPYSKAEVNMTRGIFIPRRCKLLDIKTDWQKVIPVLSDTMVKMATPIIRSWSGWDSPYANPIYHARSFRTKTEYVRKWWLPPKDGISFHISEYDKQLINVFQLANLTTNRRFLRSLKGVLGVIYVVQKHFVYQDINKKRRRQIIREVIEDSTIPELAKDREKFVALMSVSFKHLGGKVVFNRIAEFVTFLKKEGYLTEDLWREYLNFEPDIEIHRQEFVKKAEFISSLTSDIQIAKTGFKKRKILKRANKKFVSASAVFFTFKVYDEPVIEERTIFDGGEVPF